MICIWKWIRMHYKYKPCVKIISSFSSRCAWKVCCCCHEIPDGLLFPDTSSDDEYDTSRPLFSRWLHFFPLDIKNIFKHLEPANDCAWEGAMECKLDVCLIRPWQRHVYSKEFLSRRDKIVWNIVILKIVYWEQACHSCDMHLKRMKFNQKPESALLI